MKYFHRRTAISKPVNKDPKFLEATRNAILAFNRVSAATPVENLQIAYATFKPSIPADQKTIWKSTFITVMCEKMKIDSAPVLKAFNDNGQDFTKKGWTTESAINIMAKLYTEASLPGRHPQKPPTQRPDESLQALSISTAGTNAQIQSIRGEESTMISAAGGREEINVGTQGHSSTPSAKELHSIFEPSDFEVGLD